MINLQLPLNPLGYGVVGFNIAIELAKLTETKIFPIGQVQVPCDATMRHNLSRLDIDFNAPTLKIWHQHDLVNRVGNGRYYGWPIFELCRFTQEELISLRCPHELIVCSHWAAEVIREHLKKSPQIVPLGINPNIFKPQYIPTSGPYKFFTIGKIEKRKGHDVLIECFNRAFEKTDDVELHMLWNNPFLQPEQTAAWESLYKNSKLGSKVYFSPRLNTQEDVANFISNKDCGVFISRAEGWNLELLESMACGKHVIATNCTAHGEFCNINNALLVDIDKTEPAHDGIWFHGQGEWGYIGESEKEQIIFFMREAYQNFRNKATNEAGIETGKKYTWESSAQQLLRVLNWNS